MAGLAGLGAVNKGYMENNAALQALERDAQVIQQGKQTLAKAEREVTARAAAAMGIGALGRQQPAVPMTPQAGPQPPMPGQASAPRPQPNAALAPTQAGAPSPVTPPIPVQSAPLAPVPASPFVDTNTVKRTIAQVIGVEPIYTSGYRDPAKNAAVGGVEGSYHTRGEGQALDLTPPPGMTMADLYQRLEGSGLPFAELINEGDHIHIAWEPGAEAAPTAADAAQPVAADVAAPAIEDGPAPVPPEQRLGQIAEVIRQQNPGIDEATLFEAIAATVDLLKGVAPDYRAEMQAGVRTALQEERLNAAAVEKEKDRVAREQLQEDRQAAAAERDELTRAARDARDTANRAAREAAEARRAKGATAKSRQTAAQQTIRAQQDVITSNLTRIQKQIDFYTKGKTAAKAPEEKAALKNLLDARTKLLAAKRQIDRDAVRVWQAGEGLPRPSAVKVEAWKPPAEAPPATGVADGSILRDDAGKALAKAQGGRWVEP